MLANVAVSQAAYAEASGRVTRARAGIAAARVTIAQAVEKEKRSQLAEVSVD